MILIIGKNHDNFKTIIIWQTRIRIFSNIFSEKVRKIGDYLGIDWTIIYFNQFKLGVNIEFEYGDINPVTDVIAGPDSSLTSELTTGKIALAHLCPV